MTFEAHEFEAHDLADSLVQSSRHPVDITLEAYEDGAREYAARNAGPFPAVVHFLDRLARMIGNGCVLELGSGPGRDADYLEGKGVRVIRTDAALSFVEIMRAAGRDARQLDVLTDDFGGPHDAVLANAVLLHLPRQQLKDVLRRLRPAIRDGGLLAFTVKEGTGSGWTTEKLGRARYFVYWQEAALRQVLVSAGWTVSLLEHRAGSSADWLQVVAR